MKQKSSRVLTEKTENASVGNAQAQRRKRICLKAPTENGSKENRIEADRGGPHVRFKRVRRRPKTAVVAGVEPRRDREIGVYQEL